MTVQYKKNKKTKTKKLTCSVRVTEKKIDNTIPSPTAPPDSGEEKRAPGLYNDETGKLEVSWDKLVSDYFDYDVWTENYIVNPDVDLSGTIVISDTVTEIGNTQFENCTGLTNVVIPDSVTSIGNYAFRDCTALQSIHIPKSVTHIGTTHLTDAAA